MGRDNFAVVLDSTLAGVLCLSTNYAIANIPLMHV